MDMLACRACRVPLAADVPGCGICSEIRRHLVSSDEDEETMPSLSGVAAEELRFLRSRLRWTRRELEKTPDKSKVAAESLSVANALTKLLDASRKLHQDGVAAVAAMSFAERARLFVGWYAALPPPYRSSLRAQMDKFELDAARPVGPTTQLLAPGEA